MNGTTNNNNNERVATCTDEYTNRPAHFRMIMLWIRSENAAGITPTARKHTNGCK